MWRQCRGTQQTQQHQCGQGDIDDQAVEYGNMGRVQNAQPFQGMTQKDQEKRRCEGAENGGEEGNKNLSWASPPPLPP